MRDRTFLERKFVIPELGIDGDAFHAKQTLLQMIWRFQPRVAALLQNPHPFPEYTGIHIRRGDKVFGGQKEADLVEAKIYYEAIKQYADGPCTIVIASDDQHSVSEFR